VAVQFGAILLLSSPLAAKTDDGRTKPASAATRLGSARQHEPTFADYPASPVYTGKVVPPRFQKSIQPSDFFPDGDPHCGWDDDGFHERYYGAMKPNFAGHYVITGCTCGTGCHYFLMWDARTGEVIRNLPVGTIEAGPYFQVSPPIEYAGENHRVESSLLVLEGCFDWDAHPERRDCARYFYVWKNEKFALIFKQATRVPPRPR
jgi:hypothetical protein